MNALTKWLLLLSAALASTSPHLRAAPNFSGGIVPVLGDYKFAFFNEEGNQIGDFRWDLTGDYFDNDGFCTDDRCAVLQNGKWGFVDSRGMLKIECKWSDCNSFRDGLAPVKDGSKWGYIDIDGELKIPLRFEKAYRFSEGLAAVHLDGKLGFIDKSGKLVIPCVWDDFYNCHFRTDNKAVVKKNGRWHLLNRDGSSQEFDDYKEIPSEAPIALRWKDGFSYYADKQGRQVGEVKWETPDGMDQMGVYFNEGLGPFKASSGKWGYIDEKGKITIEGEWDYAMAFHNGLAIVRKGDKSGAIDPKGELVVPLKWDALPRRFGGGAMVGQLDSTYHIIDRTGKTTGRLPVSGPSMRPGDLTPITRFNDNNGRTLYAAAVRLDGEELILRVGTREIPFEISKLSGPARDRILRTAKRQFEDDLMINLYQHKWMFSSDSMKGLPLKFEAQMTRPRGDRPFVRGLTSHNSEDERLIWKLIRFESEKNTLKCYWHSAGWIELNIESATAAEFRGKTKRGESCKLKLVGKNESHSGGAPDTQDRQRPESQLRRPSRQ